MNLSDFLCIVICVYSLTIFFQSMSIYKLKKIKKSFESKIKIKTDFEKLEYIIGIFKSVNFSKLRPDQLKLWNDWINNNLK